MVAVAAVAATAAAGQRSGRRVKSRRPSLVMAPAVVLMLVMWCWCSGVVDAGNPDAKRLYDDLLSNYNKIVRPVVNNSDVLTVRIKLKLSQLIDLVSCVQCPVRCLNIAFIYPLNMCNVIISLRLSKVGSLYVYFYYCCISFESHPL